jgi:hypothetical protein
MTRETLKQRDKRKLDLQLDKEFEGTFPASDPLKITRFSSKTRDPAKPSRNTNAGGAPFRRSPQRAKSHKRELPERCT